MKRRVFISSPRDDYLDDRRNELKWAIVREIEARGYEAQVFGSPPTQHTTGGVFLFTRDDTLKGEMERAAQRDGILISREGEVTVHIQALRLEGGEAVGDLQDLCSEIHPGHAKHDFGIQFIYRTEPIAPESFFFNGRVELRTIY